MRREPGTAGIDPARIVDAAKKDHLMPIIRAILPESGEVLPAKEKIHRFLGEMLQLVPQADALVGATRATMKLTLVVSEASAKVLLERLEEG